MQEIKGFAEDRALSIDSQYRFARIGQRPFSCPARAAS
jgi:hypothetical protein